MTIGSEELLALSKRHVLTVIDEIALFPDEEGTAYLQNLIAATQAKLGRTHKA